MRRNDVLISDNFWARELECPCCGRIVLRQDLLDVLEAIRKDNGNMSLSVTSGCRCMLHNKAIYDRKNDERKRQGLPKIRVNKTSPHLIGSAPTIIDKGGWAADLPFTYDLSQIDEREKWLESIGVVGVGFGENFTHVDIKPRHDVKFRSWVYSHGKPMRRTVGG